MKAKTIVIYLTLFIVAWLEWTPESRGTESIFTRRLYSDTLDVVHYGIHLTDINVTTQRIKGYTDVTFTSKIANLAGLKLELTNLTVDSIFVGGNKSTSWTHQGVTLEIPLPSAVNPGDTLTATVYYQGKPFLDPTGWGGFHFSGEYAFNLGVGFGAIPHNLGKAWFPCLDDFRDRAQYDWYIRVSNDKKAVCGGLLMDVTDHGDNTSTWHWKTTYTLPTYLASVSTGKYALVQDQYQGINGTVPVTFYCRPGDTAKVPGTFVNLHSILSIFENRFGPYPFERVGFTATAQGAMEHASNISYPYSGWNGNTSNDWWYGHELSHMWFGDAVTCASAEDMWLNEGWARWCETVITEGLYGQQAAKDDNRAKLKEVLQHTHVTDGGYYALYGIPQTLTYGSTVYDKGGQVTHTLRHYLGDSLFFGGVKACLQQYACQPASSFDLRDFLSTYSGTDLAAFFDAWVFTPGFPHFSVDSMRVTPEGNAFKTIVFVRQKAKGTTHLADENHLGITFLSKDWQFYIDTLHFSGRNGSKTFSLPFEPVAAMADLDEQISDATTDYAMTVKSTGEVEFPQTLSRLITTQVADSAFVRITHNWVAPDSLRAPVPGLRLSDYRYWTVEGLFTPGFRAKAKFSYSRSNNLDNNLLTDSKDSLVILYRPGAGHEWRGVKFTKQGSWFLGTLTVDSLATGDYTLAVWDDLYAGTGEFIPAGKKAMQIYPNPAPGKCTIETETVQKAFLRVYDTAGKLLDTIRIGKGKNFTGWSAPPNAGSVLVFRLAGADGEELSTTKVVFKN